MTFQTSLVEQQYCDVLSTKAQRSGGQRHSKGAVQASVEIVVDKSSYQAGLARTRIRGQDDVEHIALPVARHACAQ